MDVETAIEIRVEQIGQLFDTLDPFPFRERDLDKHAEEYIVGWAREFPRNRSIKIIVHAPKDELRSEQAHQLGEAFARYFNYRAEVVWPVVGQRPQLARKQSPSISRRCPCH